MVDCFDDNNIHFFDIAIDKDKTKFHGLNPFTTEQRKFVHQVKSFGFNLTR